MRVAWAFIGKEKILEFEGGFHGTSERPDERKPVENSVAR